LVIALKLIREGGYAKTPSRINLRDADGKLYMV
jgi:hypothetical protein